MSIASTLLLLSSAVLGAGSPDFEAAITQALNGTPPQQMMSVYLDKTSTANLAVRKERYEALKTPDEIWAWQEANRAYFVKALGGFPERTPLNAKIVSSGTGEGFRFENVLYESRPQFYVTGTLFLPTTPGPYPAVLFPCGHDDPPRGMETYQRACILLARYGIAALMYDPIGQGERVTYLKEDNTPAMYCTVEHTLFAASAMLVGTSFAEYRIWDGMRGIDYLQSRADVIPDKIGVTGHSGGGTLTSYLMALDPRVLAAAPCCFITSYEKLLAEMGPQDGEQNTYGQLKQGIDHADYIHMRAPKPTLLLTATHDAFSIEGSWESFREAKRLYARLGLSERVSLVEADNDHAYSNPLRVGMVQWMRRWLLGIDGPVVEVETPLLTLDQMRCSPEGQVVKIPGARTVTDFNVERNEGLAAGRAQFWKDNTREVALAKVRELTAMRGVEDLPELKSTYISSMEENGRPVHYQLINPDEGLALPMIAYLPANGAQVEAVHIIIAGDGLEEAKAALASLPEWKNPAHAFALLEVCGTGHTQSLKYNSGTWPLAGSDFQDFFRAYLNAESYVGIRAEEILQLAKMIKSDKVAGSSTPVYLYAAGEATVPALHAAAMAPELIEKTTLVKGIPSWSAVVAEPRAKDQLINGVHNALTYYDLPDLVASLPEGKVEMVDAAVPVF